MRIEFSALVVASREGRCDHAHGGPPPVHPHPGAVVARTQSWLAVALVAAAVVLMAVVSDAATVAPLGLNQRPVVTTVITLSAVPDPRATEAPHHTTGSGWCHGETGKARPWTARERRSQRNRRNDRA